MIVSETNSFVVGQVNSFGVDAGNAGRVLRGAGREIGARVIVGRTGDASPHRQNKTVPVSVREITSFLRASGPGLS